MYTLKSDEPILCADWMNMYMYIRCICICIGKGSAFLDGK